jgi:hypothetical protein
MSPLVGSSRIVPRIWRSKWAGLWVACSSRGRSLVRRSWPSGTQRHANRGNASVRRSWVDPQLVALAGASDEIVLAKDEVVEIGGSAVSLAGG